MYSVSSRLAVKNLQTGRGCFAMKINSGFELNHYDMGNYLGHILGQDSTDTKMYSKNEP